MSVNLSEAQIREFQLMLKRRFYILRAEVRDALLRSDNENYRKLAGEVHDLGEQAVADLLVDINLAEIDRDIEEIRDIDAALLRITGHCYGICADCRKAIAISRLQAYPTAKRCIECQCAYEHAYRKTAATTR